MADKYQSEATRTFREVGWTDKTKDAYFDYRTKKLIYPETGFPDMRVYIDNHRYNSEYPLGLLEIKTSDGLRRTRFPFDGWRPEQREWYEQYASSYKNYYWLFIMFGDAVNSKEYPRTPLLIQAERFLEIEKDLDRKSIPYQLAEETGLMLQWKTNTKTWSLEGHPFEKTFLRNKR